MQGPSFRGRAFVMPWVCPGRQVSTGGALRPGLGVDVSCELRRLRLGPASCNPRGSCVLACVSCVVGGGLRSKFDF